MPWGQLLSAPCAGAATPRRTRWRTQQTRISIGALPGTILLGDPIDFGRGQTRGHGSQHRQHVSCPNWKHKSCKGLAIHSDPRARRTQTRPLAHLRARAQKKLVRHAADTATPTSFPSRTKKTYPPVFHARQFPTRPHPPLATQCCIIAKLHQTKNVRLFSLAEPVPHRARRRQH